MIKKALLLCSPLLILFPQESRATLIVEYTFDGNALDSSGNGEHGTLVGNATFGAGKFGQALKLDGSGDYVHVNIGNYGLSNFTVEAWVNVPTYAGNVHYVSLYQESYIVLGDYGDGPISTWAGGLNPIDTPAPPSAIPSINAWHHFAFTFDGSYQRVFVDGVEVGTAPTTGTLTQNSISFNQGLTIGARYTGTNQYVSGALDNVRLHDVALNSSQLGFFADGAPSAVPDGGSTILMFGASLLGLGAILRKPK